MGINLTGQTIASTYQELVLISGSVLSDGTGSDITSLDLTASNAVSASSAVSASHALVADDALTATSASYALSASHAENADTATSASHALNADSALTALTATSASHALNADAALTALTATSASHALNADAALTANTSISASFATTASYALNVPAIDSGSFMLTGSVAGNILTFEKVDGNTFSLTVDTGSAALVDTGSLLVTASISDATITFTKGDASTFDITVNNVVNASSASVAISASHALNADTATSASFATTASYALNAVDPFPFTGDAVISGSLNVSSSIGASNVITNQTDTFTPPKAYEIVTLTTAEYNGITPNSNTLYYITDASAPLNDSGSFMITGSVTDATSTFTKGDGSTFALTVNNVENASSASVAVSASHALNADAALTATSASHALNADNAISASYALTASALEGGVPEGIWTSYTGSNNAFLNTASFNYTIAQGYATSSQIENSIFAAVNSQIGSARNSAIIGGTGQEMYDNTGGFGGVIVENSVILGGTSNGIFGDADGTFIIGGNNNQVEADDTNNSGIIGGASNVAYAVDNTVVVGGSSNLLRSTSDNTIALGSSNNTLDFTSKTALVNSHNNSNGDTNTNVTLISTDGLSDFQDYNVYIGVNGSGRTFAAGTSTTVKTYIDDLTVSGSVSASFFVGDGSGLTNIPGGSSFPYTGSAVITGSLAVTGSVSGEVKTLSVSSNTASIDCSTGNFFKLTIPGASTTQVVASNITPGQTINVLFEQESNNSGSITFPSYFKFAGGFDYAPTLQSGSKDIVSIIAFDATDLYTVSVKNLL
jgi:hypothetical protein